MSEKTKEITVVLRFTVGPWFETEEDGSDVFRARAGAESASCIAVEKNTARAWDWGERWYRDGGKPSFNMAAWTRKWPQFGDYSWGLRP